MDGCYIPNNPHFGLLEFSGTGGYGSSTGSGQFQTTGNFVTGSPCASGGGVSTPGSATYWSPSDDMGSFTIPPLDLDPLPSLFPFSPCSTYKSEKQPHDMADVLLSLKHAVVHPGQMTGSLSPGYGPPNNVQQCAQGTFQGPSASLSYTVHPHQMMSPAGGFTSTQYCPMPQDQSTAFFGTSPPSIQTQGTVQHHNMFPSMSVNVSMNMTMHGYPTNMTDNLQHQITCPQMQWTTATPNPSLSPGYSQTTQGLLSPQAYAGGATYSFTADFRPQPMVTEPALHSPFKPINKINGFTSPNIIASRTSSRRNSANSCYQSKVITSPSLTNGGGFCEEPQRPNLCRICGKTYARPSTLKTHLRTHSGEKPYRCIDCNKSFSQAANLTAHVRTHSGEKPFRCPICDRRFSQSSSVTTHMRTHSGERPYRCRLCKKAFSDSSTLTKHLRIHSGEKPYQCKLCLLRFSQSGNLNRHMRIHGANGSGMAV